MSFFCLIWLITLASGQVVISAEAVVFRWLNESGGDLGNVAQAISALGGMVFVGCITVLLWVLRKRLASGQLALGVVLSWLVAAFLKTVVDRPRPAYLMEGVHEVIQTPPGNGFVSLHAALSTVLAVVLWPLVSAKAGRVALVCLAALIGISRVVLGVHLPLDVVGGACLGVAAGAMAGLLIDRLFSKRRGAA